MVSAPARTASRHNSSTSSSGYVTLPRCRGSGRSRKWARKTTASPNAPQSAAALSIAVLRESEDSHRFSTSAVCHVILHPIALGGMRQPLDERLLGFARDMRKESTDAERRMWSKLRDGRLNGLKFRRQVP